MADPISWRFVSTKSRDFVSRLAVFTAIRSVMPDVKMENAVSGNLLSDGRVEHLPYRNQCIKRAKALAIDWNNRVIEAPTMRASTSPTVFYPGEDRNVPGYIHDHSKMADPISWRFVSTKSRDFVSRLAVFTAIRSVMPDVKMENAVSGNL
ncbi:hypothetical protein NDU88_006044 [Pleurodeles waltl]|uniref:Uncharacterized protein n=1 Tax=Pleurodeles waltl TaxID=8319 RepID=A0AAV7RQR1_PLEWA|nr:hypothetical protein NDU88_006044 [Pleurodeles waltl]